MESDPGRVAPVERFHQVCIQASARLPFGLNSVVAPTFLGFVLINSFTFFVDLVIITALHGGLGIPLPIAVTVGYGCAFALSYFLNRTMNFRSHAPVGPQVAVYVVVVVVNYLAFILGVSTALTALGVQYHLSRIAGRWLRSCVHVLRDAVAGVPRLTTTPPTVVSRNGC